MFFYRPRRAEPIELAGQFTPDESARINTLRVRFHLCPDHFNLGMDYRRLEFARWLVDHGHLGEWDEKSIEPSSECLEPCARGRGGRSA